MTVAAPLKPTWERYLYLLKTRYSLYRAMEYELLSQLPPLTGKILDVGGGKKASYFPTVKIEGDYSAFNIDSALEPTELGDLNKGLPYPDNTFDNVLTLNTLEHIYKIDLAVEEIGRVLKPGGELVCGVPFIFRVHGSPDDYSRKTASWWTTKLTEVGFDPDTIVLRPIMWDVLSAGLSITEFWTLFFIPGLWMNKFRRATTLLIGLLHASLKMRGHSKTVPENYAQQWINFPLGYLITARKKA